MKRCRCGRPAAFRVKHVETSRHWRCMRCFRALVAEGPVSVTGYAVPKRVVVVDVALLAETQGLRAIAAGVKS